MPEQKKNKTNFLDDKRIVILIAFMVAFVFWVVVAGFIMPADERELTNVLIDYNRSKEVYEEQNLQIVDTPEELYVDVDVRGDGSQLGLLDNTSVTAYPDYSQVTEPGVYEIPIRVSKVSTATFSIYGWSVRSEGYSLVDNPKTSVTMTFEAVERKTFAVNVDSSGITPAENFFKDNESVRADPAQVTVVGPKSKVDLIVQVVAKITVQEERSTRKLYQAESGEVELLLLDEAGEKLDPLELGVTVTPEQVNVEIPILEIRTIGVVVDFIGQPKELDMEWFSERINLSEDTIQVAGSTELFENLQVPYPIDTFNISELTLGWQAPINISLPDGLRIYDEHKEVVVSFDTTDLVEKTIVVDNIRVVNGLPNATITPMQDTITVKLIGDADQINALTSDDIFVEVDAFDMSVTSVGQQTIPARVEIPGADMVIPIENYSVVCEVSVDD